jgi:hypothetical protein
MGYHLTRRGSSVQIVDAGAEIGHVWRSRWDSLRLFTAGRHDNLPGLPFPAAPDAYPGPGHRGPSPGLYMLGLTWQHTRGSALLGWVSNDAAFLASQIMSLQGSGI